MFVIWTTAGRTELATVWIAVEKSPGGVVCAWSGAAPLVAEQAANTRTIGTFVSNRRTESSSLDLAVFAFDGALGCRRAVLPIWAGVTIAAAVCGLTDCHHGLLEFLHGRAHGTHIVGIQRSLDRRRLFGDLTAGLLR